jgi:hypothetical protein
VRTTVAVSSRGEQMRASGLLDCAVGRRSHSEIPFASGNIGWVTGKDEKAPGSSGHWTTRSARRSKEGGTTRPIDLAVLRLMTSSMLAGSSTGRSVGLAPLRILSTK